jgi:hypothetical protein
LGQKPHQARTPTQTGPTQKSESQKEGGPIVDYDGADAVGTALRSFNYVGAGLTTPTIKEQTVKDSDLHHNYVYYKLDNVLPNRTAKTQVFYQHFCSIKLTYQDKATLWPMMKFIFQEFYKLTQQSSLFTMDENTPMEPYYINKRKILIFYLNWTEVVTIS